MKQDYDVTSVRYTGWWGYQEKFLLSQRVNWKSNDLLKMLGLNKTELKLSSSLTISEKLAVTLFRALCLTSLCLRLSLRNVLPAVITDK
jgi:hypothetical protein